MKIDKSFLTNLVAASIVISSFFVPTNLSKYLFDTGFYALSGAITNWLAIYMLFERVPFLYGSGIIELNFEVFKKSIKEMMMEQFFSKQNIQNFLETEEMKIDLSGVIEKADMNIAFDALKSTIMESKFGGMLGMIGGESVLESFREQVLDKLRASLVSIVQSNSFHKEIKKHLGDTHLQQDLIDSIETIVTNRLNELTPEMVKNLIKTLINEHLGWLVVWGGVFGGIIGLVASFVGR
jgi:uncharacterized membrane protein YheB (UPF0754 family)